MGKDLNKQKGFNMSKGKKMNISDVIKDRLDEAGDRYWANDNISEHISEDEKWELIDELEDKFRGVLSSLIIDQETDPNSHGTARRLAKMYVNETMAGRFIP